MDIAELKRKSVSELQDMPEGLNIPDVDVVVPKGSTVTVDDIKAKGQGAFTGCHLHKEKK